MSKNRLRGFTLVELLLSIAIIALLATLTSPAISKALKRAQSVGCAANLKKLAVAMHLAVTDNDNHFPYTHPLEDYGPHPFSVEDSQVLTILDTLSPYGITKKDLRCPSDKIPPAGGKDYRLSYQWNAVLADENGDSPKIYRRSVISPSLTRIWFFRDIDPNHSGRANQVQASGTVTVN